MTDMQPTDRELEALKVLWDRGEATVRDVCEEVNRRGESLAYTTVLSLLQVMEQKRLVSHRREGKAYVYRAEIERGRTFRRLAAEFLDRVFDGAVDEYVLRALESRKLSEKELEELEAAIADAKRSRRQGKSKKGNRK